MNPSFENPQLQTTWLDTNLRQFKTPSLGLLLRTTTTLCAFGLVVLSCVKNWFDVPLGHPGIQSHHGIFRQSPPCQIQFQVSMALGLLMISMAFLLAHRGYLFRTFAATWLVLIPLTFPYFVMLQTPALSADATWLQMQHDNLTWLGGDINSQAEAGMSAWKSKVYLVDPPRQVAVAPLPTWSSWDIGLDKLKDLLVWCGYSNVFCQFARSGWFFALGGGTLLMIISMLDIDGLNLSRAGFGCFFLTTLLLAGLAFALLGPFSTKEHLQNASREMSYGNNEIALDELRKAAEWFPVLSQDTYFISQKARLENRLGIQSDYSQLDAAKAFESSGKYDQSFQIWRRLCDSEDAAVRREALRAVLRFAVQDFNCNRIVLARQRFQFVLSQQPAGLKAIYYLQIIAVKEKDHAEAFRMCDWMYTVTDHLNFKTTKILRSVSQQHAKLAAALNHDASETWARSIEAR